jgi:hypothetical protein
MYVRAGTCTYVQVHVRTCRYMYVRAGCMCCTSLLVLQCVRIYVCIMHSCCPECMYLHISASMNIHWNGHARALTANENVSMQGRRRNTIQYIHTYRPIWMNLVTNVIANVTERDENVIKGDDKRHNTRDKTWWRNLSKGISSRNQHF